MQRGLVVALSIGCVVAGTGLRVEAGGFSGKVRAFIASFRPLKLSEGQRSSLQQGIDAVRSRGMSAVPQLSRELSAVSGPGRIKAGSPVATALLEGIQQVASSYKDQGSYPLQLANSARGLAEPVGKAGIRMDRRTRSTFKASLGKVADLAAADVTRLMKAVGEQLQLGKLGSSPQLKWTRDVARNPQSDWGIYGVGEVFKEKRDAVTNLERAENNVRFLKQHVASLEWLGKATGRGSIARLSAQLDSTLGQIQSARQELRGATQRIWSHQWSVTAGAAPQQVDALKAMFDK